MKTAHDCHEHCFPSPKNAKRNAEISQQNENSIHRVMFPPVCPRRVLASNQLVSQLNRRKKIREALDRRKQRGGEKRRIQSQPQVDEGNLTWKQAPTLLKTKRSRGILACMTTSSTSARWQISCLLNTETVKIHGNVHIRFLTHHCPPGHHSAFP